MNKFIFVIMIAANGSSFSNAATATAAPLPIRHLSVQAQNIGARDAIKSLLDQSGLKYDLPSSLTNTKKISIEAKDIAWSDVFKMTTTEAGYTYEFDSKNVLHLKPTEAR
ncbi:MAG: hypothetical protein ACXWRE_17075 [Pseudobdellovibrionaceae bacterium]